MNSKKLSKLLYTNKKTEQPLKSRINQRNIINNNYSNFFKYFHRVAFRAIEMLASGWSLSDLFVSTPPWTRYGSSQSQLTQDLFLTLGGIYGH